MWFIELQNKLKLVEGWLRSHPSYPAMDGCNNFYADGSYYAFETEDGVDGEWNFEMILQSGSSAKEFDVNKAIDVDNVI